MASEKQLAANRRNSLKSTGPTSVAGKAAASMNALKTGLRAKSIIIPGESARDLQALIDEYYAAYHPATPETRGLVDDLIRCEWTLRRLDTCESSLWNYQIADSFRPVPDEHKQGKIVTQATKTLAALQRRIDATRRGRDRALQQLRELAAQPLSMPEPAPTESITSNEIGFVRPTSPNPPEALAADPNPQPDANYEPLSPSSKVG